MGSISGLSRKTVDVIRVKLSRAWLDCQTIEHLKILVVNGNDPFRVNLAKYQVVRIANARCVYQLAVEEDFKQRAQPCQWASSKEVKQN